MADVEDAIRQLARAHDSNEPVCISAEHARTIHNLITADPAVLAANIADVAIDALFAAREVFWSRIQPDEDTYWYEHRRLKNAVRAIVDIGWLELESCETINANAEND